MSGVKCQGMPSHRVPILPLVLRVFRVLKIAFQITRQTVAFMVMSILAMGAEIAVRDRNTLDESIHKSDDG